MQEVKPSDDVRELQRWCHSLAMLRIKNQVFNSVGPETLISVCKGGAWGCVWAAAGGGQWVRTVGHPRKGWKRRWMFLMELSFCLLGFSSLWDQSELGLWAAESALQSSVFPDNHTLLKFRENHSEMGMPREGFCRDLTDSVVPDHWGKQIQNHYWQNITKISVARTRMNNSSMYIPSAVPG